MLTERSNILEEIYAHKRLEVEQNRQGRPLPALVEEARCTAPPLDFLDALRCATRPDQVNGLSQRTPALIAEVKRRSPSRGLLRPDFDPLELADLYRLNGAAAISVLTDERYFGGRLEHLQQIAQSSPRLPLLRKDFIFDRYQVYEARAAGADAILLIVAGLETSVLHELHTLSQELGMAALVEVHTRQELETALALKPALIGINNRDLQDFNVRLETSERLRPHIPAGICVVAESGIHSAADVWRLSSAGVNAILVGEALVSSPDTGARVRELIGKGRIE